MTDFKVGKVYEVNTEHNKGTYKIMEINGNEVAYEPLSGNLKSELKYNNFFKLSHFALNSKLIEP